jgi:Ferritin-like
MTPSAEPQPIRWVRYHVRNIRFGHQLKMLDLPTPSAAPPSTVPEKIITLDDPSDVHAGTPAGVELVLELPDRDTLPPIAPLTTRLLQVAAEIEHGLLVQYLYAAYSQTGYKPSGKRDVITGIAIEEMSHLMTVQNLLMLLGQPPHLHRQAFALKTSAVVRLYPFPLMLEPLSKHSLAKYVLAEAPESADQQEPVVMAHVREAVGQKQTINRVGLLYAFLGVVFGTKQLLMERAAEGDEWYQMIHRLAAILAVIYGGRDKIHLPDSAFPEPNPNAARQGTDEEWDRSMVGPIDEFRVFPQSAQVPLIKRGDALTALRDIGIQGEGSSMTPVPGKETSHFRRFLIRFKDLFGEDGSGNNPVSAFNVPSGAVIPLSGKNKNAINHPDTVPWARLANLRYALLLGFLEQYLVSAPADRRFLISWVFAEMYHLKMLATFLVKRPRSKGTSQAEVQAAVPFTLPPDAEFGQATPDAPWPAIHADRLGKAVQLVESLLPPPPAKTDEAVFLTHVLASDRRKLNEARARQTGKTVRTRFDVVREILDWGAGAGAPHHSGTSPATGEPDEVDQRRFWNLTIEDFKKVAVGDPVIGPSGGPGSDPLIVNLLKTGFMPRGRPKLGDAEIAIIAQWIKDGCPDTLLQPPAGSQSPPAPPAPNS